MMCEICKRLILYRFSFGLDAIESGRIFIFNYICKKVLRKKVIITIYIIYFINHLISYLQTA